MAENEPWDELTPPETGLKPRYSDNDDRTMLTETSSSASSSHRMPSRWAQYERDDDQLRHDSHEANIKAVELAAEKVANSPPREFVSGRINVTSPMDYDSDEGSEPSWANDAAIRAEALKMLEIADERYSVYKTQSGGFSASYSGGFGGSSSLNGSRRSSTASQQKRVPRALAGIDFAKRASTTRVSYTASPRASYDVEDAPYCEEEGLVDVIEMENSTAQKKPSKWSSRYSIDHTLLALSGGRSTSSNPRDVLEQLERETDREIRSARNMFVSSPHETPRIFGAAGFSGFTSRLNRDEQTTPFNPSANLKSWRDSALDSNGKSLTPPEPRKTWQEQVERKKRQQRQLALVLAGLCALIFIAVGVAVGRRGKSSKSSAFGASGVDRGAPQVVFYVTSDSPYDSSEEQKLTADLQALGDAEFIVHLGNIQDASVTLCSESRYARVKDVLLQSPVPMFILPGEQDWNNCPNPENAWETWLSTFGGFESNFDHNFMVNRQMRRKENFAFVHKDVLFMGFHLVGGRNNADELDQRLEDNINWLESMVSMNKGEFKYMVLLGNARPGPQQKKFFDRLGEFLGGYGLPIIYVHANSGVGGLMQYDLFGGDEGIEALQIEDGGQNPPLRISVYDGDGPFVVG